jgi:hypothetical protein
VPAVENGYEIYFGPRSTELQVLLGVPWPPPYHGRRDKFIEQVWNLMENADYSFQRAESKGGDKKWLYLRS